MARRSSRPRMANEKGDDWLGKLKHGEAIRSGLLTFLHEKAKKRAHPRGR